jgi:tetratricopeptide (TPR) repeat protein
MTQRAITLLAVLTIIVAAAVAYSNSFRGPFIFDDIAAIQRNESIRNLFSAEILIPPGRITVARRPLANLSFAINYAISGLAVTSYHIGNLLIHVLAALALFGIVRRTLLLPPMRGRFGAASTGLATAVALIWAIHPLQTESVTYIVQRAESLMGLCYLLTLYAVIRSASSERPHRWHAAAVAACALGMGAKEVMATAPIVVLLYDRAFLSGSFREAFRRRKRLYFGLAATWAVLAAIMLLYEGPGAAGFGISAVAPWRYALTQPGVLLHYLRLTFWPQPLCLDYAWPLTTEFWQIVPQTLALAALLAATAWALVRQPALGFLGAWFFLILAPTSSVMPIDDACFEHRMYLSLAAPVAAAAVAAYAAAERLLRRPKESQQARRRRVFGILALPALCAAAGLGMLTFQRNAQYRSRFSIWEDVTRNRPKNPRGWSNLGLAYADAGRFDDAFREYDEALKLNPDYPKASNDPGNARSDDAHNSEAGREYNKASAFIALVLHAEKKQYAQALADASRYEKLGGRLDPGFVKTLIRAADQGSMRSP